MHLDLDNSLLLSPYQELFFYEWELDPLGYNVFFLQEIHGSLDIERLSLAWKRIVRDFLYYHLYVSKEQGKILLASFDNRSSSIEYIDQALSFDEIKSLIRKPFDLTNKSSLTRLCVIKKGIDKYCILFVCHHLISGGMIIYDFVRLLSNYYNDIYFRYSISIKTQQQENLLFVRKVKGMLETHREILMNFWREKLEGGESISLDFLKLPQGAYKYNKENKIFRYYSVPLEYVMGVARLAKQRVVTDYIIYITTLSVLFYKHLYEAPSKLLFSLPYLVNSKAYIQGVNNIFIPFCITRTKSFLCLLEDTKGFFKEIKKTLVIGEEVIPAYTPTYWMIDAGDIHRLDRPVALVQQDNVSKLLFSFDGTSKGEWQYDTVESTMFSDRLIINMQRVGEQGIRFFVECKETGINEQLMDVFFERYFKLLGDVLLDATKTIGEYNILTDKEYQYLLYDYNKTERDYPKDKTIHQLFEEQVTRTPNNIAVVFEEKELTYQELNNKANQLAYYLYNNYQTKADDIICLLLERSEWMIIAILGVLKSGAAYCPISPEYPEERVLFILRDTQPKCLITNCKLKIENIELPIVNVTDEQFLKELYSLTINHLPLIINSHALAYIIYTSGTTGNPKGVMIEHSSVINLQMAQSRIWLDSIKENNTFRLLLYANYSFDAFVFELFASICNGHTSYLISSDIQQDFYLLANYIQTNNIEIATLPPAILQKDVFLSLDKMILAGESPNINIIKRYYEQEIEVFNAYGPTEITVCATMHYYSMGDNNNNIGKPIDNKSIYVLNNNLQLLPIGSIGELYIGGDGVARGYLNRPELTAERFIKNPFQTEEEKKQNKNERIYKTGDLVRMLSDGNIEYIGRNDFQVKIRGYRIELGEIENRIQGFQTRIQGFQDFRMIEQAVVLVNKKAENKYLVGYFVAKEQVDVEELRSYLSKQLPDYMVPIGLVQIDRIPLTVNGKLDRKALLAIEYNLTDSKEYKAPKNELEQQLLSIWEKLLGNNSIGVQDDFFRVGGDSIKSIQLSSRVRSELGKELSVKDVFEHRTIERMVSHVLSNHQIKVYLSEQGKLSGELNLLPIQQYFFELKLTNEHHYNQSFLIETPELEIEKLKIAIEKVVEQHDAFRLAYRKDAEGNIIQYYDSKKEAISLDVLDISEWNVQEGTIVFEEKLKKQYTSWQDSFNIYEGKTYQMAYIWGYKNKTARIFIAAHHLIIDAVSWRILLEDIEIVYKGKKLLAKRTSYRQWVNIGKDYVAHYPNELSYWEGVEKKVQENIAKLSSKITIQEEIYFTTITIDRDITSYLLLSANQVFHTEVNDLLLTALARALGKLFDEQEVSIILEGHGRESLQDDIDISKTMGWFTSIVPIHLPIYDNVQASIIEVKEELRRIPNKGIGYGFIRGYKHLPKISFNYLGVFKKEEKQDWFLTNESSGMSVSNKNKSNLWLDINGGVGANGVLGFSIRGRLTKEYIDNLSIYFKQEMIVITNYIQSVNRSYLTTSDTNYIVSKDLLNRLQQENEIQAIYVANSLQAGFIYHYLSKSEGDDAYKVQLLWKYKSQVNEDYFIQSWQQALDRYPGLRVRFNWEEEIVQIIDKKITLDYRFRDIQHKRNKEKAIETIRIEDRKEDYDLAKGNLLRVYLIQVDKEEFVVLYSNHHAISDGWSNPNLLNYIHEFYNSLINQNTPVELLEDQAYLRAQEYLQVKSKNNIQDKWWVDYLSGVERTIDLRGLRKQEANGINLLDYKFIQEPISKGVKIRDKEYRALSSFIKQEGFTWSNLIMWCWSKALSVYDNRNDNIIGITLSGRGLPINDIEQSVGLYINTLPLVVRHSSNESILNILKNIQKDTEQLNQLTHTHLSSLHSNASDRLFATMVVYENYPRPTNKDNQDAHALMPIFLSSVEKTDYPLTVLSYEKDGVLSVEIKYAGELFEEKQIERLLKLMSLLLQQIPICYNKLEQELILIDNEEYNYLVYDYNKTEKEYPKDKTIHQLFEEQVARTPNNIAVVFEEKQLTYQELNKKANQLAHYLHNNYQTKADDIICLLLERSEWMIIAILGVFKSGATYCPISPEYPEERILFILQDTQPKCLIINCKLKIENVQFTIVNVTDEQFLKKLYSLTINHLPLTISSHSLAYIIYTSGTIGNPKGVMVEHKNVVNLLYATAYILYPINQTYLRASAFTSYQFDVSVSEFLSPLVQGGELHIFNELAIRNISFLSQYIIEKSINYLYIPPVLLSQLPQHIYPELKHIIYAGEPCNRNIANDCSKNYFLFNYYGPTEATIYALGKQINIDEVEQIGKPIYNIKIYLLNTKLQVVPIGSIGELYIGGDGVARGYLNRPELTAERFIKNPFQTEEDKKKDRNSKLYKTGDLVRMLPDGNIEYIGRNDFQVKIRGYRIELGEIENRIQGFQDFRMIEQAVVLVNDKGDNKYLVGYFVAKEQVDVEELRSYLSKQLPEYMVPTGLLQIEQMPLTVNGKLDRKALLAIEYNLADSKEYKAPKNELEQELLSIWEKLLGNNSIGVQDDFFRVGGDSIKSIQLSSRVRSELGKELSVKDVFEHRTIERMVSHVLSNHQIKVYLSEQGKLSGELNLLPIQQYFFELKLTNEHHYNQSFLIETPELEIEKLKMAIGKVVEQHDAFRLTYKKDAEGNIIQYYDSKREAISLDVLDISEWNVQEGTVVFEEKLKKQYTSWQDGFDIYEGKTYQMAYIWGYKNKTARIFIAAHHLIIDAVSWRILLEDIETVYTGKKLLAKRTSYRQWANLGKEYITKYPNELNYWEGVEKKVQENIAKLSSKITIQEESYFTTITIDNNITNYLLLSANQVFHTEINDLLLTALARALGKLFDEQEVSILLEGHGRESLQDDIDISKTMGWFTSIIPIHLPIYDNVQESIIEVKEELRRIPNKGIGYGFIRGYKHLPKISFNYLGVFKKEEQQDWFLTNESSGMSVSNKNKSNLWLDINGGVGSNGVLEFSIRGRLTKEYIDNLSIYFKQEMIVITNYIQSVNRSYLTTSDTNYILSKDLLNRLQRENEIQAIYVANSLQAGFIYHYLSKSEGDDAYKVQLLWKYKSQVNEDYFIQSWQQVLDRYPGLRVRFNWEEEIVQIIDKKITLDYRFRDIQDKRNKEKAIEGIRIVDRKEDYDLAKGNLLRVYLIQVDKEEFVVLYSNHHAISDGWSNPNLLNYIHEVYNSLINQNTPVELLEEQAYLRAQEYLQVKSKNNTHDRWWVDYLSGVERTIDVRGLRKQEANGINLLDYKFIQEPISKGVKIRDKEYRALSSFIKQEGLTWSNLIMWCWSKALSIYDNRHENIIGITLSGRGLPINDIEQSVGLYINTLPLVVRHDSNESILNILKNIQKDTEQLNQLMHTHLSGLHSNASDRLFATMVVYENYPIPTNKDNQESNTLMPIFLSSVEKTDYPLTILAYEKDSVLSVEIKYAGELFEEKQIERLLKLMSLLLQQIPICYNKLEQELILIDNEEYNYLIYDYNKTEKEYPKDKTIHQLFEEQVVRTPNNIAVVFEEKQLTYQELNNKANQLAHYLHNNYQTKADDIICLLLKRSEWMIISILGVLKSGAAYCPISPEYPEERVLFILRDTQPKCLITNCKLKIENVQFVIVNLMDEEFLKVLASFTINHLPLTISSHALVYIIYTSGTTGLPKGVMVTHQSVSNLVYHHKNIFDDLFSTTIHFLGYSNYIFDASVWEYYTALLLGYSLYLISDDIRKSNDLLLSFIRQNNIEIALLPPIIVEQLDIISLRILFVGGDRITNLITCKHRTGILINAFGPTEYCVIGSTHIYIDEFDISLHIGKPITNTKYYVLNPTHKPLPMGAIGELYIGGDGVARGYLNRPELTAERFIKNPFQTEEEKKQNKNERIYKTGDLVRMLPDGNIEYIGRNDFQVKIRGYRIELGEIENRIQGFQIRIQGFQDFRMIEQAVVLVNEKGDNRYLVGYFVAKEQVDVEELRIYLSKQLPDYMVPIGLVQIDRIPLTVNGKLDRKALLAIEYNLTDSKEYKAPKNELEQQLLSIWEKLLGNNSIGVQDDFFRVGGDSIKSIQLSSRVRSELGRELSVKDVFEHRTIERMVSHVLSSHQIKVYLSEQGKLSGELNLLPIQQYFFELKLTNEHHYNQSFLIETPELEIEKLKIAIEKVVEQHDAFRLTYRKDAEGNIIQYYDSKKEAIPLDVLDISEWNVQEGTVVFEEKLKRQYTSWQDSFNIYEGKTYQMAYIWGYKNKTARIFIAAHHLIIDAVSWRILLEDIETVYAGKKLLAKRTSYRQWVNIGKDYVAHYPNELSYWEGVEKKVQENIAKLSSKITIQEEDYITTIAIDSDIINYLLLSANQVFHTEVNDLLLTALARALGKLFNEQEISILLEGHGRESLQDDIDISKTMGWFTSIVPIHLPIYDNVQESIIEVKEELRRIPNKGIGYGFIRGYKHLPKISFNYLGVFKKEEQQDWFLTNESSGMSVSNKNKSNLWLDINGGVFKNGILEFSIRGRLTKEYIDNLSIYFKQEMIAIANYIQSFNRSYLTPSDTHSIVSKDLLNRLQIDNEIQAIYVANSLQAGFIYHYLSKSEGDDAYKVQLLWKYKSQVNEDYFIQSWQQALDRYPGLRVRFNWEEEIVQIIDKKVTLDYRFRDIQHKRNKEKAIEGIRIEDRKEDYDLAKGNLLRVYLIQVDKEEFVVLYSNHHAISDGWSNPNLLNYIHEVYNSLINQNTPVELLEDQAYLRAQEYLQLQSKKDIYSKWWVDYLSGVERTIDVRGLRKQEANGINLLDYKFIQEPISKGVKIRDKEYRALSSFIKQEGLTWSNLIMWCWSKALSVYDNRNDNIIGITLSGRGLPINDIEQSVGLYINTLPLVVRHDSNESILNILKNIQKDTEQLNQLTHTHLSGLHSNASDRLFATMVVYENYPRPTNKDNQDAHALLPILLSSVEKTDYPLTVLAYEKDSVLSVEIKYAGELFEEKQIERLLKLMSLLLQQIPICYNKLEQELRLIDNEEYHYLVYDYNKTEKEFPKDKTIHQLFEEQVARTPNNIAVVFEEKQLTYQELNSKANQLAHYLHHHYNTKIDDIICLLLERSEWMIIVILGVLKSGAAYCPISPEYPEERVLFILQDTQPKCLITNCKLKIENVQFLIVNLIDEEFLKVLASLTINHLPLIISPHALAYIIYTSGTTGNPKGVMVEHKNVVNLLYATAYILYPINQTYLRATAFTSYQFDVSVSEFLSPLVQGGELHIFNDLAIRNITFLSQYVIEKSINYLYIPPVLLSQLPQHIYPELKHIIYAGEPCNRNIANDWSKNYLLFNYYGPTESTIYALGKQINIDEVEQIGKPIYNIKAYLLNTKLQVVPIGSIGELYIGGDGVARGYLNRPELTAERFIKNPFQTEEEKKQNKNERIYKTGDLVRMLSDGNIEYIGRNDFQVKIRGYRIELGEIEIRIQGFQTRIEGLKDEQVIEQAVVLVNDKGDNKYLVGYFVAKEQVDIEELRSHLSKQLPEYMVPIGLVQIEQMPLTVNGKLDRKYLLDIQYHTAKELIVPHTTIEKELRAIWAKILDIEEEDISISDSFFRLGGNSILMIRVLTNIKRQYPDVVVNMPDLFTYPTIVALSSFIEGEIKKKVERDTIQVYCRKQIEQEDIAVIAMSGEFSQVGDLEKLWEVLEKRQETAKRYTMEECESLGIPKSVYAHSDFVPISNAMGFSSAYWDALFFKQTPQTARWLHPNIRKLVEHAWLCLDSTGYTVGREKRNIGVYAGVSNDMNYMVDFLSREDKSTFWEFSSLHASAATQVSYMLNLRGVALTVQTACSTGLAVVDTACIALQHGYCDMAIAGASRIDVQKRVGYMYSEGSIYSKDGYCKTFDEGSSGTIGGNGVGVVLLKRLSDAKRDGDKVLAVIKSTATNNDGSNKVSYTAPSVQGQSVCIAEAHLYSKTTLEDLDYIECHGTATALGDPIEVEGLYQAIEGVREIRKENHGVKKILLGSVKANIGHTDTTAGMVGLIKVLLMLQKEMIPGQPNFEKINPHIAIEKTCFEVSKHNRPWIRKEKGLRTAGVSSFGIGGTNVHLVVQESDQVKEECMNMDDYQDVSVPYLFVMSAESTKSLDLYQEALQKYIAGGGDKSLRDMSYSLLERKEGFRYRRYIVASSAATLQQQLSLPLSTSKIQEKEVVPNFVFLFDGQGSWYPNAGYEWYRDNALFRQAVDRCLEITQLYYDFDYREVLYPSYYSSSKKREVKGMDYIHASIFILGYGMASVLKSDGIEANAIMGHSLGELIGAVWSGLWTLEDGLGLIIERSRLMEAMPDGMLLSVQGSKDLYEGYSKREEIELVIENSCKSFVVLGSQVSLEAFRIYCKEKEVEGRFIQVGKQVHSKKMSRAGELLSKEVTKRKVRKLDIRLMSCINGDWLSEKRAKSGVYWGDQMCSKVAFSKGIDRVLLEMPEAVFIEIGAGSGLCSFIQDTNAKAKVLSLLPSRLQREQGKEDVAKVFNRLEVWGMLWSLGVKVSWSELHLERVGEPKWVDVPVYCFDKQLYVMYEQEIVGLHADSSIDMLVKSREQGVLEEQRGYYSLEEEVKQVYQLVLGYEEISEVDSFSKMGGTSLRLIQLLTKIKNLGYEITMGELLRYDSIDKLSKYLELEKERKIVNSDSSKDDNKHTVGSLYRDNILVLLREGSDKSKNIFFFHAVGGTVGGYMNIAQGISEEYNCYGIQNINVYGDQLIEVNKMEELVMIYVTEVLKVNPLTEKYYLAGSSMGGVLAYGVGSMLERMGKLVTVVTFDGWAYYTEAYHNRQRFDEVISMQIKKYKKGLQELNNKEQIDHFLSCAWKLMTCLLGYQIPKTEQLDMIICKASIVEEDRGSEANRDKLCGWRDFCGGNIDNFEIEGATHYNILEVGQNKIIEILNAKIKE